MRHEAAVIAIIHLGSPAHLLNHTQIPQKNMHSIPVILLNCARAVSYISGAILTKQGSQDLLFEGQGLMEVKQLVEQKRAVERELGELKAQLEKAGFSSLSQMR